MKKHFYFLSILLVSIGFFNNSVEAQAVRNPVLEYCTGTWCQYCPCGHTIIRDVIMLYNPNTILLAYHGPSNSSDPYRVFNGNNIISLLTFSAYPTGIVDRLTVPQSRSAWAGQVSNRATVAAKVNIDGTIGFDRDSNKIHVNLTIKALAQISEIPVINFILTENKLISPQTGSSGAGCAGGNEYIHDHVVRSMLNGALGTEIAKSGWAIGDSAVVDTFFYVPSNVQSVSEIDLNVFVYSKKSPLNQSEIHQARKWKLVDQILPIELTFFTVDVNENEVILNWETASETNNKGFSVQRKTGDNWEEIAFVRGNGTSVSPSSYSFTDKNPGAIKTYYRLKQIDFDGSSSISDQVEVSLAKMSFNLMQNFPNPFNPKTKISFSLPKSGFVSLKVYDLLGKEVAVLVSEKLGQGTHAFSFDASQLPSGVYVYQLQAEGVKLSRKMSLLK